MTGEENQVTQKFPSNKDVLNYDICMLFSEARSYIRLLSKKMAMKEKNLGKIYFDAFYHLIQLFDVARLAIRRSQKIRSWSEKEKVYKDFFGKIQKGVYAPEKLIKAWEYLSNDISEAGIYDESDEIKKEKMRREMLLDVIE